MNEKGHTADKIIERLAWFLCFVFFCLFVFENLGYSECKQDKTTLTANKAALPFGCGVGRLRPQRKASSKALGGKKTTSATKAANATWLF